MKYIRTKGRVCEFERELSTMPDLIAVKGEGIEGLVCKKNIVKQADTIEELCDEFVFIDKNRLIEHRCWTHLEWAIANCKRNNIDISTIYGAIWTEKGLIYVAKMNDKGELELL